MCSQNGWKGLGGMGVWGVQNDPNTNSNTPNSYNMRKGQYIHSRRAFWAIFWCAIAMQLDDEIWCNGGFAIRDHFTITTPYY